jgi:hypothetical protein
MINNLDFQPSMLQSSPGLLTALEEDSMFQPLVSYLCVHTCVYVYYVMICTLYRCMCVYICICIHIDVLCHVMCIYIDINALYHMVCTLSRDFALPATPFAWRASHHTGMRRENRSLSRMSASQGCLNSSIITNLPSLSNSTTITTSKMALRMAPYFRIRSRRADRMCTYMRVCWSSRVHVRARTHVRTLKRAHIYVPDVQSLTRIMQCCISGLRVWIARGDAGAHAAGWRRIRQAGLHGHVWLRAPLFLLYE